MADDLSNRGVQDRARVNISEEHEVRYWTEKWGVLAARLAAPSGRSAYQPTL
jgi:hypothetical protein